MQHIRNFCIIAHIDHGKSTLAARLLEQTYTSNKRDKRNKLLDNMDLEREKGITIKSHTIQMDYKYKGVNYKLNLIDTPGHVDFTYEVSRSIAVCEGALLIIDVIKSIQSQTISNLHLAIDNNLTIIPIINKIDLPNVNIEKVSYDVMNLLGCVRKEVIFASAKEGRGINKILEAIICNIPFPKGNLNLPLQAVIFDSIYNNFRGIEIYFKIFNGQIRKGDKIKFISSITVYSVEEIGSLKFKHLSKDIIRTGDIGYIFLGVKGILNIKVGDTITKVNNSEVIPVKSFKPLKPMVFIGLYPEKSENYEFLKDSLEKLHLNDNSFTFSPETSIFLGFGFRCGFLGILHLEIIQERLEREYGITVIITTPNVTYKVFLKSLTKNFVFVRNPSDFPDIFNIERIEEPYIKGSIITHISYIGTIISLCIEKRGILINQYYITPQCVELIFEIPLSGIIFNFYEKLKSISRGHASFNYFQLKYLSSSIVLIKILINNQTIDELSLLMHKNNSLFIAKKMCKKLQEIIPKHQFDVFIQATINNKIIARETIKSIRKNVTDKCYGGDFSRKKKLLLKQNLGKKRLLKFGNVQLPYSMFLIIFNIQKHIVENIH